MFSIKSVLFDSHTHLHTLTDPVIPEDVLDRARAAGVRHFLTLAVTVEDSRAALAFADRQPDVYAAVGIHPNECADATDDDVRAIADLLDHPKAVAVGEIGLDYYRDHAAPLVQQRILRAMMQLAVERDLPAILHNREATEDLAALTGEPDFRAVRGLLHCFDGTVEYAQQMLQRGYYISFAGNITFKKYTNTAAVAAIPADRLLVETDTPWLTPHPHRGQPNEPRFLQHTIAQIATLRGETWETIAETTCRNAMTMFRIPPLREARGTARSPSP